MNRLIIIGNGFDLAHKLNTRYSDFILDYFTSCLCNPSSSIYEDVLLKINGRINKSIFNREMAQSIDWDLTTLINHVESKGFEINYKSAFFQRLCKSDVKKNWVDIEHFYF